ncbi:MAG: hypothetical protein ACO1TE_08735 [Prosthecobacter sp.]
MLLRHTFLLLILFLAPSSRAATLETQMTQAWDALWDRFFIQKVGTFGDYLSSYEPGKEQAHLPTAEEVKRVWPNPCGYSTGMEDGMILNGAMLSILADRYAVTKEEELRARAAEVFKGMRLCVTVHGAPGFVARNVCPEDGKSVYPNSSRDQVTHFVHGLWKYYHSPLADEAAKAEIKTILAAVAERMIKTMVPETNYDFLQADGKPCWLGICRMWNVQAHEAARLPIYAAAWDVTQNERYRTEWRRYTKEAVEQSAQPDPNKPAYALLQMQCSLELLHALEPEAELKKQIHTTMQHVATLAAKRTRWVWGKIREKDAETMRMLGLDWRKVEVWKDQKGKPNPQWGPYREIWHITREVGESAVVQLMVEPVQISTEQKQLLRDFILAFDYPHNSSCGILYHIGAYWKARRAGVLRRKECPA